MRLSVGERAALDILESHGGAILLSQVPDLNDKNEYGFIVPGLAVYRKLEAKGLVIITEEEPVEELDGFVFTPTVELVRERPE